MSSIEIRGTPKAILNGVKDESGRTVPAIVSDIAGFNPLIFLLTERGPVGTNDLDSVGGIDTYGAESLRANSPFYTHQSALAEVVIPYAPVHIHRVRLPNAERAVLRVSIEVATSEIPYYKRNHQGSIIYTTDENGLTIPEVDHYGLGTRFILHYGVNQYPVAQQSLGKGEIIHAFREGNVTGLVDSTHRRNYLSYVINEQLESFSVENDDLTTEHMLNPQALEDDVTFFSTTLYPILEVELSDFGGFGNNTGLIIDDLTPILNNNPALWDLKQFIYQLRLVEQGRSGTKNIINTNGGDRSTSFCLGDNGFSDSANLDYSWNTVVNRNYSTLGRSYVYSSNIVELSDMIINGYIIESYTVPGELSFGDDGLLSSGGVNFFGGVNALKQPYQTLRLQDTFAFGGKRIGGASPVMGENGSDGFMYNPDGTVDKLATLRLFDEEVRRQLENFGDLEDPLLDIARFPISSLVDTGFSIETKEALIMAYNKRPDVFAILTTFRVAEYMEPELPPLPTPRKSIVEAVRPPQAVFESLPSVNGFTIRPEELTYTFVKNTATLTTDVTISVKEEAIWGEGIIVHAIPVGFSVAYRENNFINQQVDELNLGRVSVTSQDVEVTDEDYPVSKYKAEFQYGLGTAMTAWKWNPNNVSGTTYAELLLNSSPTGIAQYHKPSQFVWDMNYDDGGSLYLPTTNTINVDVVVPLTFDTDESIFKVTDTDGLYSLKVGGQTYTDLNFTQVIQTLKNANFEVVMYNDITDTQEELGG